MRQVLPKPWCVLLVCTLALCASAARADAPSTWRFAPEHDYGPFVFVDEQGRLAGLSVELLELIARRQRWHISAVPAAPLKTQLEVLRRGDADLISSLRPTPERSAYLAFSAPYVSVPAIVVARTGELGLSPFGGHPLAALEGRRVAVGAGYAVEGFVRRTHPRVDWQLVADDVQALRGVQDRRFDAAVVDAASAAFTARQHGLRDLASRGAVGFDYTLSFAVPRARLDLLTQLDAAIRALPLAERQAVVDRWITPLAASPLQARAWQPVIAGLGLLGAAALAALILWLRRRQARVEPSALPGTPP